MLPYVLVEEKQIAGHADISQCDALAHEEGPRLEVLVEQGQGLADLLLGTLGGLLVELHDAHGGEDPGAAGWQQLIVTEVHPLLHEGSVTAGGTVQGLVGNWNRGKRDTCNRTVQEQDIDE